MRALPLLVTMLLIGGCSCDRRPDQQAEPAAAPAPLATPPDANVALPASPEQSPADQAGSVSASVSTLHAYLALIAGKDWPRADVYWSGGKPPPRADDFALRGIEDLRSMRINNESPKALDEESPPRSVEIPVTLRVRKDSGVYEVIGWYRMRRKISGDGWEITSASLQPSID